jgi:hypothetical protein
VNVWHRTSAAKTILAEGFRDAEGYYLTRSLHRGVWVSDVPLDINDGAAGDTLLSLDVPEHELDECEWIEEGKPYREFLVPADVLNRYGPPVIEGEDALD